MRFTKLDYCQYLLSSPVNHTITNLADHLEDVSHDRINRYLADEKLTPRLLWENVQSQVVQFPKAFILFDDTVLDKRYARKIQLSRYQYSGNEHRVIRGIGLISCVYVNPTPTDSSSLFRKLVSSTFRRRECPRHTEGWRRGESPTENLTPTDLDQRLTENTKYGIILTALW